MNPWEEAAQELPPWEEAQGGVQTVDNTNLQDAIKASAREGLLRTQGMEMGKGNDQLVSAVANDLAKALVPTEPTGDFVTGAKAGVQLAALFPRIINAIMVAGGEGLGLGETELIKQNRALLEGYRAKENEIMQQAGTSIPAQLGLGLSKGVLELPLYMGPGLVAKTPVVGLKLAAGTAGILSGGTSLAQDLADQRPTWPSILYALEQGGIDALTTKLFGLNGVESLLKKDGASLGWRPILDAFKSEAAEEGTATLFQDLTERIDRNPDKPLGETVKDIGISSLVGGLLGGGTVAAQQSVNTIKAFQEKLQQDKAITESANEQALLATLPNMYRTEPWTEAQKALGGEQNDENQKQGQAEEALVTKPPQPADGKGPQVIGSTASQEIDPEHASIAKVLNLKPEPANFGQGIEAWGFSPLEGTEIGTFYVKKGATVKEVDDAWQAKKAAFEAGKPKPVVTKPTPTKEQTIDVQHGLKNVAQLLKHPNLPQELRAGFQARGDALFQAFSANGNFDETMTAINALKDEVAAASKQKPVAQAQPKVERPPWVAMIEQMVQLGTANEGHKERLAKWYAANGVQPNVQAKPAPLRSKPETETIKVSRAEVEQEAKDLEIEHGKNVVTPLERMAEREDKYGADAALAKFLVQHFRPLLTTTLVDLKTPLKPGERTHYARNEHVIRGLIENKSYTMQFRLIHEASHAATVWAVTDSKTPQARKARQELDSLRKLATEKQTETWKKLDVQGRKNHDYYLQNLEEFIAGIFSSQNFRDHLNEIQVGEKTALQKAIEWIADALGIQRGSALEAALNAIIEARPQNLEEVNQHRKNKGLDPLEAQKTKLKYEAPPGEGTRRIQGANITRAMDLLGASMYNKNHSATVVKELIQNSFDAVKGVENATIKFDIDAEPRTIAIEDNGKGMTPEIVVTKLLPAFESGKESETSAGGYGLAKIALFGNSENFKVETVAELNGRKLETTVLGTGKAWMDFVNQGAEITQDINKPGRYNLSGIAVMVRDVTEESARAGTTVSITADEGKFSRYEAVNMFKEIAKNYPGEVKFYNQFGNEVKREDSALAPVQRTIETKGGKVEIRYDTAAKPTRLYEIPVMNNGLLQFSQYFGQDVKVPPISINVIPTVSVMDPEYPFSNNRDSLKSETGRVVQDLLKELANEYKQSLNAKFQARMSATTQIEGATQQFLDLSGKLTPEEIKEITSNGQIMRINRALEVAHVAAFNYLNRRYGNFWKDAKYKGFANGGEFQGVRFGTPIKGSQGDIYYDLRYILQDTYDSIIEGKYDEEEFGLSFGEHISGVVLHEIAHQISSYEGETHSIAMTELAGRLASFLEQFIKDAKRFFPTYKSGYEFKKWYDSKVVDAIDTDAARDFVREGQRESSEGQASLSRPGKAQSAVQPAEDTGVNQAPPGETDTPFFRTSIETAISNRAKFANDENAKWLTRQSFDKRLRATVPNDEIDMLNALGFKEFLDAQKGRVNLDKAKEWVLANVPKVEVRKFGRGPQSVEAKRHAELTHKFDTEIPDWRGSGISTLKEKYPKLAKELQEWQDLGQNEKASLSDTSHWQSIAPKPESEMKDYVEIAVVKPQKKLLTYEDFLKRNRYEDSEYARIAFKESNQASDPSLYEPTKFPSSHNFPPNTLGFVRGYMEGDTFHVIEVQSDWAQQHRKNEANFKERGFYGSGHERVEAERMRDALLAHYERLALKAAIEHALEAGAKRIAIQDAESAMMMEGHDRNLGRREIVGTDGRNYGSSEGPATPPQEKGMRLHYDQILPNILAKLTGSEGEKVSFGEHKMAFGVIDAQREAGISPLRPREDLIFRNPDGTPKTDVSALSFELPQRGKERPTLFEKNQAPPSGDPLPFRYKDYAEEKKDATTPRGLGKVKVLNRLFDPRSYKTTPEEQVILTNAISKVKADSGVAVWLEKLKTKERAFVVDDAGEITLADGSKGYMSDVIEAEIEVPGSQALTPEQKAFVNEWKAINEEGIRYAAANGVKFFLDEDGNTIKIDEPHFPRPRVGTVGGKPLSKSLATGAKPGSAQGPFKQRYYATEAEGRQADVEYEADEYNRVAEWLRAVYRSVADARLAKDPNLKGRLGVRLVPTGIANPMGGPSYMLVGKGPGYGEGEVFGVPALKGRVFPAETARKLQDFFHQGTPNAIRYMVTANNLLKAVKFTMDVSAPFNQGLAMMAMRPGRWAKATALSYQALFDGNTLSRYLQQPVNAAISREMVENGVSLVRLQDFLAGGERGAGQLAEKIPFAGRLIHASARSMGAFLTIAKIELYKSLKVLTKGDKSKLAELGEIVDNTVFSGRMEQVGITQSRALVERLVFNAPSYLRAAGNLAVGVAQGGITSKVAARALGGLMASVAMQMFAAYKMQGLSDDELKERFDPRSGKFMRISFPLGNGKSVEMGYGNVFLSLSRLIGDFVEIGQGTKTLKPGPGNPAVRWLSYRKSPVVDFLWQTMTGKDFQGNDIGFLEVLGRAGIPIPLEPSVSKALKNEGTWSSAMAESGAQFFGLNAFTKERPTMEEYSREKFGRPIKGLTVKERYELKNEFDKFPKPSLMSEERATIGATQNEFQRRKEVIASLPKAQQKFLAENELQVPPFQMGFELAGKRIPLSSEEAKLHQQFVQEEYAKGLEMLMESPDIEEFKKDGSLQRRLNIVMRNANTRARNRLKQAVAREE